VKRKIRIILDEPSTVVSQPATNPGECKFMSLTNSGDYSRILVGKVGVTRVFALRFLQNED